MVFGIHCNLHVVSHHARALGGGGHRACIWIGPGYLAVRLSFELFSDCIELTHLLTQALYLVLHASRFSRQLHRLGTIGRLERA